MPAPAFPLVPLTLPWPPRCTPNRAPLPFPAYLSLLALCSEPSFCSSSSLALSAAVAASSLLAFCMGGGGRVESCWGWRREASECEGKGQE